MAFLQNFYIVELILQRFIIQAQVVEEDRSTRSGVFPTGYPTAEHPPLTSTEFVAQDQGKESKASEGFFFEC